MESAKAILSQAQQRTEIAGRNIANSTVPAYKRRIPFASLVQGPDASQPAAPTILTAVDFRPGKLAQTGNPYDLAIAGSGFFAVQREDGVAYVRAGRFTRREDGRLIDAMGGVLQNAAGGDVIAADTDFTVKADGSILAGNAEAGRIAIYDTQNTSRLSPLEGGFGDSNSELALSDDVHLVQGSYETSNVSSGEEMVAMMQALRMAESGQRVMIAYDDIMGRVLSTFGEAVR